jgi:hypothetical protein
LAVSAETTPVDTHDTKAAFAFGQHEESRTTSWEWEIRLTSPPKDLSVYVARPVCLERLFLSSDQDILIGTVAVVNLAFRKHVAARFTFDDWKTASEVSASLCHDRCGKHSHDWYDRFTFDIKLNDQANLERKTMSVCISYSVNGPKFWDNNNEMNYRVEFVKTAQAGSSRCSRGPRPVLHRSRSFTSSHTTHPRSASMSFDDLPEITSKVAFANSSASATRQPSGASDDIDTVTSAKPCEQPHFQTFANRYVFGASLSAAILTKSAMDRTTLAAYARSWKVADEGERKLVL